MAEYVILRGLADLEGLTVGVFLAGIDCGDFTVTNGKIVILLDGSVPSSGDAKGFMTERLLTQVSALAIEEGRDWGMNSVTLDGGTWIVPCVIGFRYASRGQRLRPVAPGETGARNGPAFGKLRRNHKYAVLLEGAGYTFSVGPSFDKLKVAQFRHPDQVAFTPTELYSGIHKDTIEEGHNLDGMIAWEVTGPFSAKVAAIGGFLDTSDE